MKKSFLIVSGLITGLVLVISSGFQGRYTQSYHEPSEMKMLEVMVAAQQDLPVGENSLFTGSGKCAGCHGKDANEYAGITAEGWEVNVTDHWRSSIMGNSAKDPFWKAKVSHEVAVNPDHQLELEDKCTSCHAPMGHFAAHFDGAAHYTMAMLASDSLGMDGVSCNACHQQDPENIGNFFSGELEFVEDTIYGPYGGEDDPIPLFGQPMTSFVGFEPLYGEHVDQSETCAGCHTLSTSTADLDGNLTGNKFVEQATYHEWLNSIYAVDNDPEAQECQGCHMPRIDEPIVISANYIFLQGRSPYGLHYMAGANTFMLEMFRDNVDELGLAATPEQFDTSLVQTMKILTEQTVDMELNELWFQDDTIAFEVFLQNKAGHKFPSGYPARRAFIELELTDGDGNTLFHSGEVQDDWEVFGHDATYEPHYDEITEEEQVQIYELVLGDVNGDVTTVLERADIALKDNRIAPIGFSTSHEVYDTTEVVGLALMDENWNHEDGIEGSGSDRVLYKIGLDGYAGDLNVTARVYYQPLPPKWMEEMFSFSTPEIDYFKEKYEAQGADPVMIAEDDYQTSVTSVGNINLSSLKVYPNPSVDGMVQLSSPKTTMTGLSIYDGSGRLVDTYTLNGTFFRTDLPEAAGVYTLVVETTDGVTVERLMRW